MGVKWVGGSVIFGERHSAVGCGWLREQGLTTKPVGPAGSRSSKNLHPIPSGQSRRCHDVRATPLLAPSTPVVGGETLGFGSQIERLCLGATS